LVLPLPFRLCLLIWRWRADFIDLFFSFLGCCYLIRRKEGGRGDSALKIKGLGVVSAPRPILHFLQLLHFCGVIYRRVGCCCLNADGGWLTRLEKWRVRPALVVIRVEKKKKSPSYLWLAGTATLKENGERRLHQLPPPSRHTQREFISFHFLVYLMDWCTWSQQENVCRVIRLAAGPKLCKGGGWVGLGVHIPTGERTPPSLLEFQVSCVCGTIFFFCIKKHVFLWVLDSDCPFWFVVVVGEAILVWLYWPHTNQIDRPFFSSVWWCSVMADDFKSFPQRCRLNTVVKVEFLFQEEDVFMRFKTL
jgi:hypothetical protein